MTVHMFRPFVGLGPMSKSDLESRMDTWRQEHTRWLEDNVTHELREYRDENGNFVCWRLDVRFEETDTKSNILQKFEDKLISKVDWYRVGYHVCHSDRDPAGICGWDDVAEWTAKGVTIPGGVPDMGVTG